MRDEAANPPLPTNRRPVNEESVLMVNEWGHVVASPRQPTNIVSIFRKKS